jgi:hypothetical protein
MLHFLIVIDKTIKYDFLYPGCDRVQGSTEHIVIEMFTRDALSEETFNGDIVEKLGKKIEAVFDEPETVENHCLDDLRMAEMMVTGLGEAVSITSAMRRESQAPATIPRWPIDRIERSSKPVTRGIKGGFTLKVQRSCGN